MAKSLPGFSPFRPFFGVLFLCTLLFPGVLFARLNFSGLDLSEDNRLLFRANADTGGGRIQNALMLSRLNDHSLQQLTAFPEKIELIENGRALQIRNAFGALRLPIAGGLPRSIKGFPAFAEGAPVLGGRVEGTAASGDGRWLLVIEPVTSAYGNLMLLDTSTGMRTPVAAQVERPDAGFPACWSPDSRVFVYSRGGKLYYHSLAGTANTVDERYRLIGEGGIASVYWGSGGDFFYLRGSTVYRVRGSDLFARALYADFLEIGTVAGKIPFEFDPNFDAFWIGPDSQSVLLSKGGRNIFYFRLGLDDYSRDNAISMPYLMLPRSSYNISVLWSLQGIITIVAAASPSSVENPVPVIAYRLNDESGKAGQELSFRVLNSPPGSAGSLSRDGKKAVFWGEQGCVLYNYENWTPLLTLSNRPVWACLWLGNEDLIMGDSSRLEKLRLEGSPVRVSRSLMCLSSADLFGFDERADRIYASAGGAWFATDGRSPWTEVSNPVPRPPSQVSSRYRVYLERQGSGPYENIPMIRNTVTVGTEPLLRRVSYNGAGEGDGRTGGAQGALREIAVCFDLYDDATGLPQVLQTLRLFGIRATFFVNGEFIRRYPGALQDIAVEGHEIGSMFFAPIDLSDSRYQIQGDFISRGLARNEDEFFKATGRELSLLWHAPYFAVSSDIVSAAAKSGYKTIFRDVDPLDWVTWENTKTGALSQFSASEMIDRIISRKKPGSIVPIRLGLLPGGRPDYLYSRLGALLDALVKGGYSVVPVSALLGAAD